MRGIAAGAFAVALALLSFFQFPGHTWLQQDSQIYTAILEHLSDPPVLANDLVARKPHVALTLFDEAARAARAVTGLSFREVLAVAQIAARALGIWGLWQIALALGLGGAEAWMVAGFAALGATVAGPEVLTFEYEPTPRALALPLVFCAIGLAAHRRWTAAGIAGAAALLLHPPSALPFWLVLLGLIAWQRPKGGVVAPVGMLAAACVVLLVAARMQAGGAESQPLFTRLTAEQAHVEQVRTAYTWVSTWAVGLVLAWVAAFLAAVAAWWRVKEKSDAAVWLLALAALGLLSMPVSWALLERLGWALVPQVQPMRMLVFVALAMQILCGAAGIAAMLRRATIEAMGWFALAYLLPLQPVAHGEVMWARVALLAVLAAGTALARDYAPVVTLAAFFLIPSVGGVVNYPHLHTPEVEQLASWARVATPRDAVFVFPDAGHSVVPGIFRAEALRALYVDWKGGGQVNFFPGFASEWWRRWQQTVGRGFQAADLERYGELGIGYAVVEQAHRPPAPATPVFENARYAVYATAGDPPAR